MKHIIKILIFIIVFVILTMFFSPSFSKVSIDNIAVVVAIGMDVVSDSNTQNNIKVSFQFTDASSVSESGSTEKAPSILKTVSASSIISAINLINTYIDKEVTLSHCKLIVFSEEIAKKENGTVILADCKKGLEFKAKDGIIKVIEIQGENGKRMKAEDYLRGNSI